MSKIVPLLIGVGLIVAGGFLYVSDRQATADAEPVEATVASSEVVDYEPGDDPDDRRDDDYRASVEYRYEYEGQTYTSTNLCAGAGQGCAPSGDTPDDAEAFVADYPEGKTVTAYVQPDDPSDAYLVEGGSPLLYLGLAGAGAVVTALGIRNLVTE